MSLNLRDLSAWIIGDYFYTQPSSLTSINSDNSHFVRITDESGTHRLNRSISVQDFAKFNPHCDRNRANENRKLLSKLLDATAIGEFSKLEYNTFCAEIRTLDTLMAEEFGEQPLLGDYDLSTNFLQKSESESKIDPMMVFASDVDRLKLASQMEDKLGSEYVGLLRERYRIFSDGLGLSLLDLMSSIQPFVNGLEKLTSNSANAHAYAKYCLSSEPLLLEAFYDLHALRQIVGIRDYYHRGNLSGKNRFLKQFGATHELENAMMDSFYQAMSEIDIHHRGLPTQEDGKMYGLTRPSGYREEYASKLGSIECKMAKLLTAGILPVSENSLVVVNKK